MYTYRELKQETLACSSLVLGFFSHLILSCGANYSGLTENEAWTVWAIALGFQCLIIFGILVITFAISERINKQKTKERLITVLRKLNATSDKLFTDREEDDDWKSEDED